MLLPVIRGRAVHSNEGQELGKCWFLLSAIQVLDNNAAINIPSLVKKSILSPLPENLIPKG